MRIRRVKMSGVILLQIMTEGNEIRTKCIKGLPEGARFVYCIPTHEYILDLVVEHSSFDEVPDGAEIPIHPDPVFEKAN